MYGLLQIFEAERKRDRDNWGLKKECGRSLSVLGVFCRRHAVRFRYGNDVVAIASGLPFAEGLAG